MDVSRGSALSAARQLREQVVTVRRGVRRESGRLATRRRPVAPADRPPRAHVRFRGPRRRGERRLAIASAANLIDTLVALCTVRRFKLTVRAIESYVEIGTVGRIGYQVGGMLAMFSAFPGVRGAANASLGFLPVGPEVEERMATRHVVLLEIEDPFRQRLVEWRLETPDVYQWTAQVAVAVAMRVTRPGLKGWVTPSEVLGFTEKDPREPRPTRPCAVAFCKTSRGRPMASFWLATFELNPRAEVRTDARAPAGAWAIEVIREEDEYAVLLSTVDNRGRAVPARVSRRLRERLQTVRPLARPGLSGSRTRRSRSRRRPQRAVGRVPRRPGHRLRGRSCSPSSPRWPPSAEGQVRQAREPARRGLFAGADRAGLRRPGDAGKTEGGVVDGRSPGHPRARSVRV